jgi:hypothetical protein
VASMSPALQFLQTGSYSGDGGKSSYALTGDMSANADCDSYPANLAEESGALRMQVISH